MRKREFIAASLASLADVERQHARWKTDQRANYERAGRDSTEHGHTD
jgi:hypothetical protein